MMTVAAARALTDDDVCFVGIGLPSAACNLARLTHAPRLTLVYESGTIETRPDVLPLSIGDGELCETALTTVSVPEMFRYWLQGGRITVGFLGGAQVDRFGNLNSTVIGDYAKPKVRLPGSGGATEIATCCGRIYIVMRHNRAGRSSSSWTFVTIARARTDRAGATRTRRDDRGAGAARDRPVHDAAARRDEGVARGQPASGRQPRAGRGQTGWPVRVRGHRGRNAGAHRDELEMLRDLQARTAARTAWPAE